MGVRHLQSRGARRDHRDAEASHRAGQGEKNKRKLYSILIVIDDFADNPTFSKHDKLLHSLFTRGRHNFISTCVSTQKLRAIATIIRVNATAEIIFKLRSQAELDAVIEEISAVYPKDVILAMYRRATQEPHSFLYVDMTATPDKMFMLRFDKFLVSATGVTESS